MKIYYARPMWMIGSKEDKAHLEAIRKEYPNASVLMASPLDCTLKKKNMTKYFKMVDRSDRVIIAAAEKGVVSSGVHAEALHAQHRGKPVELVQTLKTGPSIKPVESFNSNIRGEKSPANRWARIVHPKRS